MRNIILIVHNLRSCHNVGSLLRTSDGLGVNEVILTGYTPYPRKENDSRLPHEASKITKQIQKTSLGAEASVKWSHKQNISDVTEALKSKGYRIVALEQGSNSKKLPNYRSSERTALIVGREVEGIESEVLSKCDEIVEIPMLGDKESFNVAVAAAIAMFHLRYS